MMKREELRVERKLVLMTAVEVDENREEELKEILKGSIDWSEVLFQMITHRTLNMFCYNLRKFKLSDMLDKEFQKLLDSQWNVMGERNRYYLLELSKILKSFEQNGLVVPILKGNLLASKVYPTIESRGFNDLDMLMKLDDINGVTKALEDIGYIQGHYDEEKKCVVEASRKEKILQQMASHELQEFQKLSENKFAKLIQVDINHDILWKGNCPYKIATRDLIERAIPIEIAGTKGYMLDHIDNIIQLSCHLYKEATLMIWITDLRDLKIYKFSDVYMYIRKFGDQIDWNLLVERVEEYGIQKVIYYNFHHIELMFGEIVPEWVKERLKPEVLTYLDEYGIENKEASRWEWPFFTRLFDTDRVLQLTEKQCENMGRFVDAKIKSDGVMLHRTVQRQ